VSYEIGYHSLRSGQCPASDSIYDETVSVDQEMYGVSGLDPGHQYCVGIAGRTSAGVGPFSHNIIPWFNNSVFLLILEKTNCREWIANRTEGILEDLARELSRGIELFCQCTLPNTYIADGNLKCSKQELMFQGRIISTNERDSSDLLADLEKWISTTPTVIARSELLKVVYDGRVTSTNALTSESAEQQENTTTSSFPIPVVTATVGVIVVVCIIVGLVLGIVSCRRFRSKKTQAHKGSDKEGDSSSLKCNPEKSSPHTKREEHEQPLKKHTDYEMLAVRKGHAYDTPQDPAKTKGSNDSEKNCSNPTYMTSEFEGSWPDEKEKAPFRKLSKIPVGQLSPGAYEIPAVRRGHIYDVVDDKVDETYSTTDDNGLYSPTYEIMAPGPVEEATSSDDGDDDSCES
jgi:hypothetical protein